ncbi:MAG: oxidoreductase, partial [Flavobacterium sp.]
MKSIIFFFLCCLSGLFAQTKAVITGNIKSSENENLGGINISFTVNNLHYSTITDTLGHFSESVALGEIKMTVNPAGYIQKELFFDLVKDTVISIVLEKDISFLKEVVIDNDNKKGIKTLSGGKLVFNLKELSSVPTLLGTTYIIKLLQLTP